MQISGSSSWRFEEDNAQFLHLALFTRDAARLAVSPSPDIPLELISEVPDRSDTLSPADQVVAAAQWVVWWRSLLKFAVDEARLRKDEVNNPDVMARLEGMTDRYNKIIDPPDFESLESMLALQAVVVTSFAEGIEWFNRPQHQGRRPRLFAREAVRNAAESAAVERGVPIGDMNAVVHVLNVMGSWSYLAAPGCALCSIAMPTDPVSAGQLLRNVFL